MLVWVLGHIFISRLELLLSVNFLLTIFFINCKNKNLKVLFIWVSKQTPTIRFQTDQNKLSGINYSLYLMLNESLFFHRMRSFHRKIRSTKKNRRWRWSRFRQFPLASVYQNRVVKMRGIVSQQVSCRYRRTLCSQVYDKKRERN